MVIADIVEQKTVPGMWLAAEAWDCVVRKQSIECDGDTRAYDFFQRKGGNTFRFLDPEEIDKPSPL